MPTHGLAPKEHSEPHHVAIRQRQLDFPAHAQNLDRGPNDRAQLLVSMARADEPLIDHFGLTMDLEVARPLQGVHDEPQHRLPIGTKALDGVGMQRGSPSARVCLDLHRVDGEVR